MKINFKIVTYIVLMMVLTPLIYISVSFWYNGGFAAPDLGEMEKTVMTAELLQTTAKEFELKDEGIFESLSEDPWFMVEIPHKVNTIVVDIDKLSRNCNAQIFYMSGEQELDSKQSVYFILHKGKNYIQIPDSNYNMFRMDLASQKGVELTIKDISFYSGRVVPVMFVTLVILVWMFVAGGLYIYVFKKKKGREVLEKLYKKFGAYRFYQVVLLFLIFLTISIVYGKIIISGNEYVYYDIGGGDGPETEIPAIVSYINKIRMGTFDFWTFNNGLGTSTIGFWGFVLNPFLLIVIVIGCVFGVSTVNTMLLLVQILNIILCGTLCYVYLNNFRGDYFAKAIASYIFAFNGFLVLFAQHYTHSQFCFYLLVMLIIVEKVIRCEKIEKCHLYFTIWCTVTFACSVYMGYMIAIFTSVYVIIRLLQIYHINEYKYVLRKIGLMFGSACVGIMIAMPLLLPAVNELLVNSNRVTGNSMGFWERVKDFLLVPYDYETLKTNLLRMLSNNLQGAGNDFFGMTENANDYYTPPMLFFSVFILFFIITYFVTLHKHIKQKTKFVIQIVVGILGAFMIFNRLGSAMFNAFVTTFGRYTYLLMPLFAIVAMVTIQQIKKVEEKEKYILMGALLLTLMILLVQYGEAINKKIISYLLFLIKLDIGLVLVAFVILSFGYKIGGRRVCALFTMLIVLNVTADSFITVNMRVFCTFSSDLIDEDDIYTNDALEYVSKRDESMYRLEKNYYDLIYFHDALFQNYRGISTYNSTLNANVKEFYQLYCNPAINFYGPDSFWYSFLNVSNDVTQNSLLGVKYIFSNETSYSEDYYNLLYANDKISVYQNKNVSSFGIFYKDAILKSELLNLGYIDRLNVLSKAVVLEDEEITNKEALVNYEEIQKMLAFNEEITSENDYEIITEKQAKYSINEGDIAITDTAGTGVVISFNKDITKKGKQSALEFSTNLDYDNNLKIYFDIGEGFEKLTPYYYRGSINEDWQEAKVFLPQGTKRIRLQCSREDIVIRGLRVVSTKETIIPNDTVPVVNRISDSKITGHINAVTEGYLFLPIPYEKGWTVLVDGEKTEILRADSGFLAFEIKTGIHEFCLQYKYPYFDVGLVILGLGVLLYITMLIRVRGETK